MEGLLGSKTHSSLFVVPRWKRAPQVTSNYAAVASSPTNSTVAPKAAAAAAAVKTHPRARKTHAGFKQGPKTKHHFLSCDVGGWS